jgi:hypothetical protein
MAHRKDEIHKPMNNETAVTQADVSPTAGPIPSLIKAPIIDYLDALDAGAGSTRDLVVIVLWATLSWWIYVPIHELLHAYGCLWSGGEVSRLEISPWYGANLLQHWFPFVASGSDYAGQLTGFDTKDSDLIYLATVLLPFSLTVLPGVPLLRWSAAQTEQSRARLGLGLAIPVAYAPFVSLTGDYYETGAIIATRLADWWSPGLPLERWRSDDLLLLGERLFFSGQAFRNVDIVIVVSAALIGLLGAFLTYGAGRLAARLLLRA